MQRKKWLTFAAAAAFAAGSALAAPPPGAGGSGPDRHGGPRGGMRGHAGAMMGMPGPRMLERMTSELGLTADQQQRLKAIQQSALPGMQKLREELRGNAERLRKVQPDDPSYAAVVAEGSKRTGELTARMVQDAAELRAQVWRVLTPEQRVKMAAKQAERRDRMRERRQRHAPGGDRPERR
jgi:protein CpxP